MAFPQAVGYQHICCCLYNKCVQRVVKWHKEILVVLLTVLWYAVFCFVLVEKTKSAKNICELVIENVIILGFLMADTSSKR